MMISALLLVSLIAVLMPLVGRTMKQLSLGAMLGSSIMLICALLVGLPPILGSAPLAGGAGLWYVDALGGLLVVLIGGIQWTATLVSGEYLDEELREGVITLSKARRYYTLLALFIFAMFTAVVSDNLGVLWIALEATTLATTFLVAFYARSSSLEAAWKYLIICSTGIALGLVALLVVYTAAHGATGLTGLDALRISVLMGTTLSPALLKVAFAFALVGYGTKVGLAPMHTWLPDAHSSAPAPISALLSGVLLNAALLALLRYKAFTDLALNSQSFTNAFFLAAGLLTVLVAAAFILAQADYKRLLAYSSIEHMGFAVLSIGLGAVGAVAAVIGVVAHALTKSMLFFGAGNILLRFRSTKFIRVAGVYRTLPITGTLFLLGIFTLLAVPPSPLFFSEYLAIAAGISTHPFVIGAALLGLAIVLAGYVQLVMPMLFSHTTAEPLDHMVKEGELFSRTTFSMALHIVLLLAFAVLVFTGIGMPVIERIAALIT